MPEKEEKEKPLDADGVLGAGLGGLMPLALGERIERCGKANGSSWFIMVYHGLSWFNIQEGVEKPMVYHGLSWFIMV